MTSATVAPKPERSQAASLPRLALLTAALLAAAALLVAAVVWLLLAHQARVWLAFPFTGVPAELESAAAIFANNAWLLGIVLAATLIARGARLDHHRLRAPARLLVCGCDVLLAWLVASNVLVIGAALGAYGARMLEAMLPHGPLELAAFSPALSGYLQARRGRLSARHFTAAAAIATVLLIAAALLETYLAP